VRDWLTGDRRNLSSELFVLLQIKIIFLQCFQINLCQHKGVLNELWVLCAGYELLHMKKHLFRIAQDAGVFYHCEVSALDPLVAPQLSFDRV
jgi:hypothetical protein